MPFIVMTTFRRKCGGMHCGLALSRSCLDRTGYIEIWLHSLLYNCLKRWCERSGTTKQLHPCRGFWLARCISQASELFEQERHSISRVSSMASPGARQIRRAVDVQSQHKSNENVVRSMQRDPAATSGGMGEENHQISRLVVVAECARYKMHQQSPGAWMASKVSSGENEGDIWRNAGFL